jgi:hypothetical protein
MDEQDTPVDQAGQVTSSARAAEHAIQQLCRTMLTRPSMTPAEVDIVLAHLADAAAALPQAARQLGDILAQTKEDLVLEMDTLTEIEDPDQAIAAARRHLDGAGEAALRLHRLLDAAHNETAHISVGDRLPRHTEEHARDSNPRARRPEDRQRPMGGGGTSSGLRR